MIEIIWNTVTWSVIIGAFTVLLALCRPACEKRWRYWAWLALAVLAVLAPVWGLLPGNAVPRQAWQEVLVWLAGAILFTLHTWIGLLLFQYRARRESRSPTEQTMQIYQSILQDMRLRTAPPLLISSRVQSPMLAGLLRPCLFLPGEKWSEQELRLLLRHELTHYKRHDLWYKLVLLAANALHWFNPLLYLLVREASAGMELICDSEVMAGAGQETRQTYSKTLLAAVRRKRGPSLSTHFYGGTAVMEARFRNILHD